MKPSNNILSRTHVCPWWLIRTFDNPLRRLIQPPERILRGIVRPGDRCLDIGCGFGYFTIPLARLTGETGSVTAVDLQSEMLAGLARRAEQANMQSRIRLHQADASGIHFENSFDFALVFWMAHEVPDQRLLFQQIRRALAPGGTLLLAEPIGHVGSAAYRRSVALAEQAGLEQKHDVPVAFSRAVLMVNKSGPVV